MEYAIKIDNQYFKEYVYAKINLYGRVGKASIQDGDIIGVVLTDTVERTEIKRSVGNTISTIYGIESMKDKKIEIIPLS